MEIDHDPNEPDIDRSSLTKIGLFNCGLMLAASIGLWMTETINWHSVLMGAAVTFAFGSTFVAWYGPALFSRTKPRNTRRTGIE